MQDITKNNSFVEQVLKNIKNAHTVLSDKEFETCSFENCDFSECTLVNCKFIECSFKQCNLRLVKLDQTSMVDVSFLESNVSGVDFSPVIGLIRSFEFEGCQMQYSVFTDIELQDKKFVDCEIIESSFMQVDLKNSKFTGSDLKGTRFEDCNLTGANFIGSRNYFINASSNKIKSARFSMPEAAALLKNFDIIIEN